MSEDNILVEGMVFFGRHGTLPAERELGQRFVVDIALQCDLRPAGLSDDLERTVDYSKVCQTANLVAQQRSYKTLERLCAAIADRVIEDYSVEAVWIKAAKPEPPMVLPVTEVSVEVWRQRQ